ncbi:MAG: transposase, partial [Chloracidobacterium sp.]|nr:transposase [Chloracidobacterium sp.]
MLGEVRNATVSYRAGKWYVSIQTRREVDAPVHQGGVVGIDMGVKRFATFSDGSHIEPLASFKRHEAALAKAGAADEPQSEVQQQLGEGQGLRPEDS